MLVSVKVFQALSTEHTKTNIKQNYKYNIYHHRLTNLELLVTSIYALNIVCLYVVILTIPPYYCQLFRVFLSLSIVFCVYPQLFGKPKYSARCL